MPENNRNDMSQSIHLDNPTSSEHKTETIDATDVREINEDQSQSQSQNQGQDQDNQNPKTYSGSGLKYNYYGSALEADEDPLEDEPKDSGMGDDAKKKRNNYYQSESGSGSGDGKTNKRVHEERFQGSRGGTGFNPTALILGIVSLVLAFALLFMGYRYLNNGTITHDATPAAEVMQERENPPLKAEKLDPTKVYTLKGSKDVLHNVEVSITKAQFRKDATRLWVHLKNNGGNTVQMIPAVNSMIVDNNGHTYKIDSFGGDNITNLPAGADEDIMLTFAPIRSDAKQITYRLDGVFDMQNSSWHHDITVDLP